MKIVVVGGHGLVGGNIVRRLKADGHDVSAASRRTGVDIVTGAGLDDALAGAEVLVDASNSPELEGPAPFEFFSKAIDNLLAAEVRAGVKHHVMVSVVGTDRLDDSPYFRGKALQEARIRASGLPFTIVHATQFYEFLLQIVELSVYEQSLRLSPAYIQPVASADVAVAMAQLAVQPARNAVIEMAGPDRERLSELIQRFLTEIEAPYDVITDANAPYFGAVLAEDSLLPGGNTHVCAMGFGAWLNQSEYWGANW
ncbi:SDR family oxidoreductase [Dyella japonica]|uniref:Uncharacterized protein YbjT (DUF2867 family) n=1 Tax=Dyella japonica TaxID=231455 RepID=A0ABV2JT22_9GAMM